MSQIYKICSHVIFDVDGLLLDTESLFTKSLQTIAESYGKRFTWDLKVRQMGKKRDESAKIFIEALDIPMTVGEYSVQLDKQIDVYFPQCELMPGAERLVNHLHRHGVPIALATGSDRREFSKKVVQHDELFRKFLHTVFSSDDPDVKHGKPAPDCFLLAATRFTGSPAPDKVLVFEDAPNGVEAALAAGMSVVWVPDPQCPNTDNSSLSSRATLVLKSLEEFRPETFGLPPYES